MSITLQGRRQSLSPELSSIKDVIEGYAFEYGLDFYETFFEVLDFEEMNMVAAYGGFPNRYPHWKFGMEYERLNKSYAYGLHKIYEMVINNDPCYAYLLEDNHIVDQKIVMAHVYGHCDFFKNNIWFSKTNRKMMDTMANHATKIRKYIDRYGLDTVETFLDRCLSIEDLLDRHSPFIERCTVCQVNELLSICLIMLTADDLPPSGSVPVCWITQRLPLRVHLPSAKPPSESNTQERICFATGSQPMICIPAIFT